MFYSTLSPDIIEQALKDHLSEEQIPFKVSEEAYEVDFTFG